LLQQQLRHVDGILVVRDHLLHEDSDLVTVVCGCVPMHIRLHLAVHSIEALLEIRVQVAADVSLRASVFFSEAVRLEPTCPANIVNWRDLMHAVKRKLGWVSSRRKRRAVRVQDANLAAHLRMDMAEIVDDATVRAVSDGLRYRQLSLVFLAHPLLSREEELGLVAVEAGGARIRACGIRTADLVLQLARALDLIERIPAPRRAVSTIWLVSETDRVVPVARIRLIERDGFADLDRDLWRRPNMALELVIASLTGEEVHRHTDISWARNTRVILVLRVSIRW